MDKRNRTVPDYTLYDNEGRPTTWMLPGVETSEVAWAK